MTTIAKRPVTYGLDMSYPKFSVARYLGMVQAGFLDEDEKVELLEGYLVLKMSRNAPHDNSLEQIMEALLVVRPAGWRLRVQMALQLSTSVPEPDLALLRPAETRVSGQHPRGSEAALVVEVAESSLARDTQDKPRIYAREGIPLYWVVDLVNRGVIVYTEPSGPVEEPTYRQTRFYHPGEQVPLVLDGATVASFEVADLLPLD